MSRVGLCAACTHVKRIQNRRGSVFLLCQLSYLDPAFRRYPPLPVLQCRGFEPAEPPFESKEEGNRD